MRAINVCTVALALALFALPGCGEAGTSNQNLSNVRSIVTGDKALPAMAAETASCVDTLGNLTLIVELAERGIPLEGVRKTRATWNPPTTGGKADYYYLEFMGVGDNDTLRRTIPVWTGTTIELTWPSYVRKVAGRSAGVNSWGRGEFSDFTDWLVLD